MLHEGLGVHVLYGMKCECCILNIAESAYSDIAMP